VAQSLGAQITPQGFLIAGHLVFFAVLAARFFIAGRSPRSMVRALLRTSP